MDASSVYMQLEFLSFDRIAFAHSLVADNYTFQVNTQGYGIYGNTPKNGGILEIGFVEEGPLVLSTPYGKLELEENGIFIIPPESCFDVYMKKPGQLHRHTSAEFLICSRVCVTDTCTPPDGKTITLPLYIPPHPDNSEILSLIRAVARAKTAQLKQSYFEECGVFMTLLHKLSERALQNAGSPDTVSPGNRRYCLRAKAYVSEHISRRITITDIADAIGISKNYLTNVFSGTEGIPLMEYINRSKLSHMLVLIRRYNYTLAQAGKQVGFTDVNYISRVFKRYYGMTVTEYKRSMERKDDGSV